MPQALQIEPMRKKHILKGYPSCSGRSYEQKMVKLKEGLVPGASVSKESACNAVDLGSIPGLERSRGEGNGNLLRYSCLENPMDRGA